VEASRVLGRFNYSHPVIDHAAYAAQRRWEEISGRDRIHYCGAYWRWGFHEDGCWSAHRACAALLAETHGLVATRTYGEPTVRRCLPESQAKVARSTGVVGLTLATEGSAGVRGIGQGRLQA